jgi:uncharacterized protein
MLDSVARYRQPFTIFGGEALLLPLSDLEILFAEGMKRFGRNSIQTNGSLISEAHIRLFRQYNVQVGISIDGPGPLNDARWVGSLEKTRYYTERTEAAIEMLVRECIIPGLIVTLHKLNAAPDKLRIMHEWFRRLDVLGIDRVRLHALEVDAPVIVKELLLDCDETIAAFLSFHQLQRQLSRLRFDVFDDIRSLLLGRDQNAACVWKACDPYTTPAVQGVERDGTLSNCDRTNKDGISFVKSKNESYERYIALYYTPQTHGGCRDCRFFLMCKGQCPGTAIDGDWRNRSRDCEVWKALFETVEEELIERMEIPISIRSDRRIIESMFNRAWVQGRNFTLTAALETLKQQISNGSSTA